MNKLALVSRYLLGLIFTVFGMNFFLHFLPMPQLNEAAMNFMMALMGTGYMMAIVKVVEVVAGVLLLANRFVPLALVLLFPIVLNIFFFHLLLDTSGLIMAVVVLVLNLFLAYCYRSSYAGLLSQKADLDS